MVSEDTWQEMERWIKQETRKFERISLIGTGGNINSIFKQSGLPPRKPLSYIYLNSYYENIIDSTYEERVVKLDMNPDRADVIIHATRIYLSAMKWSRARKIYVPKIGLSDGIVKGLYQEEKEKESKFKSKVR